MTVAAPDYAEVILDGWPLDYGYIWANGVTLNLTGTYGVLALYADSTTYLGILASTSTGVVTDASWKCSTQYEIGWDEPGFDDAAWSQARVLGGNDGSHVVTVAAISPQAKWIWTQDMNAIGEAHCRKTMC